MTQNEMGGTCGTYGDKRNAYGLLVGILQERDSFQSLDVDGRIILNWILKN
jgi:hypothetical protein